MDSDELHVHDWESFNQVFRAGSKFDRDTTFYNNPQTVGSILNAADGEATKPHKNLFVGAFSRSKVTSLEPRLHEKLNIFLARLESNALEHRPVDLDTGYQCLTGDLVMEFSYQHTFGFLDSPDFSAPILKDMEEGGAIVPVFWYFPRLGDALGKVINRLPSSFQRKAFPAIAAMNNIGDSCRKRLTTLRALPASSPELETSIFKTALYPNAEKGQYVPTPRELVGDAVLMFLAGTDTTASTLSFGTYHVMTTPSILAKLVAELDDAMPDPQKTYSHAHLEGLPYLKAVIKESLRFSHGASARLMRITPKQGAVMCGQKIPPGTRVSFSNYVYNNDEEVFKDPHRFQPERWLVKDVSKLEERMVSFSRGSRSCLGIK
jgi:cytochrome P450